MAGRAVGDRTGHTARGVRQLPATIAEDALEGDGFDGVADAAWMCRAR